MCQEAEWLRRIQNGDQTALEMLVDAYQPLVYALVRRLGWHEARREELIQAGNVGLLRAVQRFDVHRGVKLATYAVPWILGEIRSALRQIGTDVLSLDEARGEEQTTLLEIIAGEEGTDLTRLDLHLAIHTLCREEQLLICLRYFRDKTQKETAALLHKSQAQISKMERHALEKLRERMR